MWIMCWLAGGVFCSTIDPQGRQRKAAGNKGACASRKPLRCVDFPLFSTENTLLYYYYSHKNH
jgi:hypothetical protein